MMLCGLQIQRARLGQTPDTTVSILLQAFVTSSFASFLTLPSKLTLGKQHLVFETCLPREEKDFGRIHVSNSVTFANSPAQEKKMNGSAALCEVHLRQPWE